MTDARTPIATAAGLALAWLLGVAVSQAPAGPQAGPQKRRAVIVAVSQCADPALPKLVTCRTSATALATALATHGYEVTVLTDASSAAQSAKDLADRRPLVTVRTDLKAGADDVWTVLKDKAKAKDTALVLLVLSGHGVQRDGQTVYLTAEATQHEGGLPTRAIDRWATAENVPLVSIVDACRLEVGGKSDPNTAPPAGAAWAPPVELVRGPVGLTNARRRTFLYATHPGDYAPDRSDLVGALARGLQVDGSRRLEASRQCVDQGLPLWGWFLYGIREVLRDGRFANTPKVERGVPDVDVLVIPAAADANVPGLGGQNLLALWRPQHGRYRSRASNGEWKVWAPAGGADDEPWAGGYVEDRGKGFDTAGKALFVEMAIRFSPADPWPPAEVSIGLDAKHIDLSNANYFLTAGRKAWRTLPAGPTGRYVWCKLDLNGGKPLNYFAVTDLGGGVLSIRRMVLDSRKLDVPEAAKAKLDLLVRWWQGDPGPTSPHALRHAFEPVHGRPVLRIGKGAGWLGGVLGPAVRVDGDDTVNVAIENTSDSPASVLVEVKQQADVLAAKRLALPAGISRHVLRVTQGGLADYLAFTKPTADLLIHVVELEPGVQTVAGEARPGGEEAGKKPTSEESGRD